VDLVKHPRSRNSLRSQSAKRLQSGGKIPDRTISPCATPRKDFDSTPKVRLSLSRTAGFSQETSKIVQAKCND
jgi:hypothetical protein